MPHDSFHVERLSAVAHLLVVLLALLAFGLTAPPDSAIAADADHDGLSDARELSLGTCSKSTNVRRGFSCARAADPRDTDGDGISDKWEVLGRGTLDLPRWGADPRHKDLFIEVDYMLRCPGEAPLRMTPEIARTFASYYEDRVEPLSGAQQTAHAGSLRNPDRKPGIKVHLDTGVPPETPADATIYGDWGGYTAVPRARRATCKGADYRTAWKTNMAAGRRGIFRYALPFAPGDGGQTDINSFSFTGSLNAATLAHELGHGMGLGHSGPSGATGVVDPNCKPNYASLMNYAFLYRGKGFADGTDAPPLNNAALREWRAASPANSVFLHVLADEFGYWVDPANGHVDWNRDGTIAPEGTKVRAYANYRPRGMCEYTRYNKGPVSSASSMRTPAMARLDQRLYTFYVAGGAVRYTHSNSEWICPKPSKVACGTWKPPRNSPFTNVTSVDSSRLDGYAARPSLLVIASDEAGRLWQSRLSVDSSGVESWSKRRRVPGSSRVRGEPALARYATCTTFLAYADSDGRLRHRRLSCANGWEPEQLSQTPDGAPILIAPYASPGIARGYLPSQPRATRLVGAFVGVQGALVLWRLNPSSGRWEPTADLEGSTGLVEGRPAIAWVPWRRTSDRTGRLYVMWIKHDLDKPTLRRVRMAMSYTKVTPLPTGDLSRSEKVGLISDFDNQWYYAYGIDLLYEAHYDNNLMSVESRSDSNGRPRGLSVRPKADGINDFEYTNFNDWATLRLGLCRNVIDPGGTGPDRVRCP